MDPLALRAIAQKLVNSDQLRLQRASMPELRPHARRHRAAFARQSVFRIDPPGPGRPDRAPTVAIVFFEDPRLPDAAKIAREYDLLVAGSTWCAEVLRGHGVTNVATVLQGVDPSLFHPAPRAGSLDGRFAVFSGGKLERRKAQDLVLLAFAAFAARHPDAVLVTSWHSPWPVTALTVNANPAIAPVRLTSEGRLDPPAWAAANGVHAEQFIDLGVVPNHLMRA